MTAPGRAGDVPGPSMVMSFGQGLPVLSHSWRSCHIADEKVTWWSCISGMRSNSTRSMAGPSISAVASLLSRRNGMGKLGIPQGMRHFAFGHSFLIAAAPIRNWSRYFL